MTDKSFNISSLLGTTKVYKRFLLNLVVLYSVFILTLYNSLKRLYICLQTVEFSNTKSKELVVLL